MNIPFVDLKAQYNSIKNEVDQAMADVLSKTAFIGGPIVKAFENNFAAYCGVEYCVGVGNGTDALSIALRALGIGAGDEVITAANSFIATSEAITSTGARVVFVDINPKTYNMATDQIEDKITSRTKAIIPVHLFGQPVDMDPVFVLAKKHGLKIVEDAAQAHSAVYKGRKVGSMGDVACFSFYPGKNLGAYGDAGAIVTNDEKLALKARMIANHGRTEKYNHELEGVNSRMDGFQGAILDVKLRHLTDWTENRRKNAYLYNEYLKDTALVTPEEIENVKAVYHLYVVRVASDLRESFQAHLKSKGVSSGIHYPIALPNLIAYEYLGHTENDFPEASKASHEIVSLPMFPELKEEQIAYIAEQVKEFQSS
jgi:dTDP-4-amino-4,6-dideoxygalactose transaminase